MEITITPITSRIKENLPRDWYYQKGEEILASLPKDKKPRLLMHVCCGPCSCFPLTYLCPHFELTLYYGNSNIYPASEYERRLSELQKLLKDIERDYGYTIKLVVPPYDNEAYMKDLEPYASDPEGGRRCQLCYRKRMDEAYRYAVKNGYDFFTTVMAISSQKNSKVLNAIGEELSKTHPECAYFYSDFKKKGGAEKGRKTRLAYGLYSQAYCGCRYSYEAMLKRPKRENEAEKAKKKESF